MLISWFSHILPFIYILKLLLSPRPSSFIAIASIIIRFWTRTANTYIICIWLMMIATYTRAQFNHLKTSWSWSWELHNHAENKAAKTLHSIDRILIYCRKNVWAYRKPVKTKPQTNCISNCINNSHCLLYLPSTLPPSLFPSPTC